MLPGIVPEPGRLVRCNIKPRVWSACFALCSSLFVVLLLATCSAGEPTATPGPEGFVDLALSRDGKFLAVGTNLGLHVYQVPSFQRLWSASTQHRVVSVAFSPDGYKVAVKLDGSEKSPSEFATHTVILWDVRTGEQLQSWEEDEICETGWAMLAFSPDGTRLVSGQEKISIMLVRDAATGERAYTIGQVSEGSLAGSGYIRWDVAWSPAGDRLAFGMIDHTVTIWDTVTGERLSVMEGNVRAAQSLAFSPDGTLLASEMDTGKVIVWQAETGKTLHVLELSSDILPTSYSVAFNPDSTLLASGWSGGTLILWDVETGERMRELKGHTEKVVFGVAFAPDGDTLISGTGSEIIMWDVKTGERLYTLESQ